MPTKPIKPCGDSHRKEPQYTKETKAVTTEQGHQSSGPEFIPIHRDWMAFKHDAFPFASALGQAQYSTIDATFNAGMQRWKAEALRNQPFHTIKAVALPKSKSASQNESEIQRSGASVGYLAD